MSFNHTSTVNKTSGAKKVTALKPLIIVHITQCNNKDYYNVADKI